MTLGPILPGRLPASLIVGRMSGHLARQNEHLVRLQEQAATGQKFFLPSDSPAAAIRTIFLQRTLERQAQLQTNTATGLSMLQASESYLAVAGDALNQAKAFALAGVGDGVSSTEKQAMAVEVAAMLQGVLAAANSEFRGRYLFGGSQSRTLPFEFLGGGIVRYNGDRQGLDALVDLNLLRANNVDGATAFGAVTTPVSGDVDPALTLSTRMADLHGGRGVTLGPIRVTVDDGIDPPQTQTIDLSHAETIADVQAILQAAFPPGALTVDVDPASNSGLRLAAAGSVAVVDLAGSTVARDLGIASAGVPEINGGDLDPRLTRLTPLSALNGGTGIGPTAGTGLLITNGPKTAVVDLSSAETVEDLFNLLQAADLDLMVGINDAGNGLAISSRLSGADFSIGENGGNNAELLGIRTFTGQTWLADLNRGLGVPVDGGSALEITRRDDSSVSIDLTGLKTVQQVLDAINAVDPGSLTATLNSFGNGISLTDDSGTDPLAVAGNPLSVALGMDGVETGSDPLVALVGRDVHPQEAAGIFNLLLRLEAALKSENDVELARLDPQINDETARLNLVRGELGGRMKFLADLENRLLDQEVTLREFLSQEFDADLTEVITRVAHTTAILESILRIGAQTMHLSLLNFL